MDVFVEAMSMWLTRHRPTRLMISGTTETTYPGLERLGRMLLVRVLDPH